VSSIDINFMA